jgi:hypothetical protein
MRDEWLPDEPPFTVAMGELGGILGASAGTVGDEDLQRVAEVLETLLNDGTEEVKNGVATGLLEALISSSYSEPTAVHLLKRLGPEAKKYCRAWDEFTGGKTPGL